MGELKQHSNHFDLSKQTLRQTLFDVIVVGSGAGGAIAAENFAKAGLSTLIVEEGPLKEQSDFRMQESEAYVDLYQEAGARKTKDKSITILQGRAVGGSTTVNWTSSFRTPEPTLSFWRDQFEVDGLSVEELADDFSAVEQKLNVTTWSLPPNPNNKVLQQGALKLGWSSKIIPRNVKGCANLGYCGMGCPLNAKQSMLVTSIPSALESGATLLSRARCNRVTLTNGRATGIEVQRLNAKGQATGDLLQLTAGHIVLAAGAIGSPAILRRSLAFSENAAINKDLIGRRTFLHPVTATVAEMPERIEPWSGAPQSVYSDQFLWRDGVSGEMGYKLEVPPIHPLIASTLIPRHGAAHQAIMARLPYMNSVLALMRDGFHPDSVGGSVELDRFSAPLLDYQPNEYLWRAVRHALLSMAELQFAAGARWVLPLHMDIQPLKSWREAQQVLSSLPLQATRSFLFSAHVMGGCGMSGNAQTGVTDTAGRVYGIDNLSVLDGSLLPTSLGVNPQLTIYAIVNKLSRQLCEQLVKSS